jgi:hypothetical protein
MFLVKSFTAGHSAFGFSGATTCRPLPPEVFRNALKPVCSRRWRTSSAASIMLFQVTPSPGSRSMVM